MFILIVKILSEQDCHWQIQERKVRVPGLRATQNGWGAAHFSTQLELSPCCPTCCVPYTVLILAHCIKTEESCCEFFRSESPPSRVVEILIVVCIGYVYWWHVLNICQHALSANKHVFNTYQPLLACIQLVSGTFQIMILANTGTSLYWHVLQLYQVHPFYWTFIFRLLTILSSNIAKLRSNKKNQISQPQTFINTYHCIQHTLEFLFRPFLLNADEAAQKRENWEL